MSLTALPVRVPSAMLTSIATGLAAVVTPADLDLDDDRAYLRLLTTDAYEAWLIAWAPGGSLDLHDHGGSAGAVAVVDGELLDATPTGYARSPCGPTGSGPADAHRRAHTGPRHVEPWSDKRTLRPRVLTAAVDDDLLRPPAAHPRPHRAE